MRAACAARNLKQCVCKCKVKPMNCHQYIMYTWCTCVCTQFGVLFCPCSSVCASRVDSLPHTVSGENMFTNAAADAAHQYITSNLYLCMSVFFVALNMDLCRRAQRVPKAAHGAYIHTFIIYIYVCHK